MTPCQDEHARLPRAVHYALDVGKQLRHSLDLIQDRPFWHASKETSGVSLRGQPNIGIFKRIVWLCRKCHLYEGGLARLAGAEYGYNRVFRGCLCQLFCDLSPDHVCSLLEFCENLKFNFGFSQ